MKNPQVKRLLSFFSQKENRAVTALLLFILVIPFSANSQNTKYGQDALAAVTSGSNNTAVGGASMNYLTTGSYNTGTGVGTLMANTIGHYNTAFGASALFSNSSGRYNTATGYRALWTNQISEYNTAVGANALEGNNGGESNSALGVSAMKENKTGHYNSAFGVSALRLGISGNSNAAFGYQALYQNVSGANNTAIGYKADVTTGTLTNATALGANAKVSASNSIQLGDPLVTQIFAGTSTNTKFITGIVQFKGGSPGAGKVLTSDDLGNATWQTPGGGGGNSPWTALNSILSYSGNAHVTGNFQVGGSLTTESLSVSQFNSIGNIAISQNFSVNGASQFTGEANFGTLRAGIIEATEFRSAGGGSPFNFNNATISETLSVAAPGNTVPANYKLAVGGNIIATGIDIKITQKWPDYVFTDEHNLLTIEEVDAYVKKHGHLPGFPSASEMQAKQNYSVAEMDSKLLEKVEELTLYIIELKKEIEALKKN